ncbi:AAA domain-containing protein [Myceligenerans xiligouense]|uniref:AAA domain-containing protein n=1 Tax=Myceligenerans xiligouense TaxID=253184 RepID=A0A3N4YMV3_9MICO|nr:AAA domain-containing protein [Myceligenerans xiligouense]
MGYRGLARQVRERFVALVREDRDVVLDLSFWSRETRDSYRRLLGECGVEPETFYVRTPRAVALARVAARAGAHRDDVVLTPEVATRYYDHPVLRPLRAADAGRGAAHRGGRRGCGGGVARVVRRSPLRHVHPCILPCKDFQGQLCLGSVSGR